MLANALLFLLVGVSVLVGNQVGYKVPIADAIIGYLMIVAVMVIGMSVAKYAPIKLPSVFWVSILALLSTTPLCPFASTIIKYTSKIDFLALCTPILAYAGLSVGKDLEMFKSLSWKIIVVALLVFTGTFVCATFASQIILHFEGVI